MELNQAQFDFDKYLTDIIKQSSGGVLSSEQITVLEQELSGVLEEKLYLTSLNALNEVDTTAYAEFIQTADDVSLPAQIEFFSKHIPEYQTFLKQALDGAVEEFVKLSKSH